MYCFSAPAPLSVTITSSHSNPVPVGSTVTVTCTVEMSPSVTEADLSLLTVDTRLSKDSGDPLDLTSPTVTGTTFTYTIQVDSFDRTDSGNYMCTAAVRPQPSSTYLTGSGELVNNSTVVTTGIYYNSITVMIDKFKGNQAVCISMVGI